jgi:hypothetical protein
MSRGGTLAEPEAARGARIGAAHDPAEREADRVAEILTDTREPTLPVCAACAVGGAPCPACGGASDRMLQRKIADDGGERVAPQTRYKAPRAPGEPLPEGLRRKFERRLGTDLGIVRVHAGADAAASAAALSAAAFTLGRDVVFGAGHWRPGTPEGDRLLAHEIAHVVQQAAGRAPRVPQRQPDVPNPAPPVPIEADQARDADIARLLRTFPDNLGGMFIGEAGGLLALERRFPQAAAIMLPRLRARFGAERLEGLRRNDSAIMMIVNNAAVIRDRIDTLLDRYRAEGKDYAWDFLERRRPDYDMDYADVAGLYVEHGETTLVINALLTNDPETSAREIEDEALRLQAEREAQVAAGRSLVGTTLGSRDILFWFDDTITLDSLLPPEQGEATQAAALLRARIEGRATAVVERSGRHYVLALNHDYSLSDALASGFDRRTELLEGAQAPRAIVVTSDGVVLRPREGRFFVEENRGQEERLGADLGFLEENRDQLGFEQIYVIFRELLRDAIFANLERSRTTLARQRASLFEGGIAHFSTMDRGAAERLQRDTAALRTHMLEVARIAQVDEAELTTDERLRLETHLLAIGLLHTRSPMAAIFVANHREPDATDPPEPGEIEDRLAGLGWGDVTFAAVAEIDQRLANIETVRNHLLRHPDAALDFEPLHDVLLTNFTESERLYIRTRLGLHSLAQLAGAIGIMARDLALLGLGTLVGGPIGLAISAVPVASGLAGTAEAFERARVTQAMTQLDLTGEFAMASPEMATSARRWAWISLGLSVVDMAGFAAGARASARLASVMASSDVEAILRFNRATLADAAERLGMTQDDLARQLSRAVGAERDALLARIRSAVSPTASGGWAGFADWGEDIPLATLRQLRTDLLARTDDVLAVGNAVRRLGYPIDDAMVALIKRYNFDSPGIAFARMNYDAWTRLAGGTGTIGDVRYILHEAEEVTRLQAIQRRTGFDFLGTHWERMPPAARARWRNQFSYTTSILATDEAGEDLFFHTGHYITAHGYALEREFAFMAEQANRFSGGQAGLTTLEAAAIDMTYSGRNAREFLMVDRVPLGLSDDIVRLQARAGQTIALPRRIRDALGEQGLRRAVQQVSGWNSMRPLDVAAGAADPTLTEFLAIIRALPATM